MTLPTGSDRPLRKEIFMNIAAWLKARVTSRAVLALGDEVGARVARLDRPGADVEVTESGDGSPSRSATEHSRLRTLVDSIAHAHAVRQPNGAGRSDGT